MSVPSSRSLSFVVPLYNCLGLTQAMLASLRATVPANQPHEIIFVDDGSTDGTRDWLRTLAAPCRVLLNEKNLGFAGACNRAADIAQGDLLFFLNNDLVLQLGWLEPMVALLETAPKVALVGNVQRNFATSEIDHAGIYFDHKCKPAHDPHVPLTTRLCGFPAFREVPALTAACFGIRRDVWRQLGGFDDGFLNGGEDVDLSLRAREAGFINYVSLRSVVRHHISQSTGRKLRDEHNSERLAEKWREKIPALAARAWSRHQIATHADQSFVFDYAMLQAALIYLAHAGTPPAAVREGTHQAFERERQRWRELLHGAAPPPAPPAVRTDMI